MQIYANLCKFIQIYLWKSDNAVTWSETCRRLRGNLVHPTDDIAAAVAPGTNSWPPAPPGAVDPGVVVNKRRPFLGHFEIFVQNSLSRFVFDQNKTIMEWGQLTSTSWPLTGVNDPPAAATPLPRHNKSSAASGWHIRILRSTPPPAS